MSSHETHDPDATIIKASLTAAETEISTSKNEIEEVIIKDVTKITKGAVKSLEGFRTFILRGNVVDLAIGIVVGAAFTAVVNSLVKDIITPLIPIAGHSLAGLTFHPPYVVDQKTVVDFGALINAVISFLIVAAVLYFFVVQPINSLMKLYHGKETEKPATRDCPYCFQAVNIKATRCLLHLAAVEKQWREKRRE
jgi:large conductance mechanosensitive channel